jgi:hypothetical protein
MMQTCRTCQQRARCCSYLCENVSNENLIRIYTFVHVPFAHGRGMAGRTPPPHAQTHMAQGGANVGGQPEKWLGPETPLCLTSICHHNSLFVTLAGNDADFGQRKGANALTLRTSILQHTSHLGVKPPLEALESPECLIGPWAVIIMQSTYFPKPSETKCIDQGTCSNTSATMMFNGGLLNSSA